MSTTVADGAHFVRRYFFAETVAFDDFVFRIRKDRKSRSPHFDTNVCFFGEVRAYLPILYYGHIESDEDRPFLERFLSEVLLGPQLGFGLNQGLTKKPKET